MSRMVSDLLLLHGLAIALIRTATAEEFAGQDIRHALASDVSADRIRMDVDSLVGFVTVILCRKRNRIRVALVLHVVGPYFPE